MAFGKTTTKVLVHVDTTPEVADVINGHLIMLPANEPVELDPFIADAIVSHIGDVYGIVEVEQVKTVRGVEYKLEEALEAAEKKLDACEERAINFYVRQQMEDRIAAGKPALPPNGRVLQIILRRGISLRDEFGIVPVGWKDPNAKHVNTGEVLSAEDKGKASAADLVIRQQQETIANQAAMIEQMQKQMQEFMAAISAKVQPVVDAFNGADAAETTTDSK